MTRNKAIDIIRAHGLYCRPLGECDIVLEDVKGVAYEIITMYEDGLVRSATDQPMSLRIWLGY